MLADGVRYCHHISLRECSHDADGIHLSYRSWLYVPKYDPLYLHVLQTHYEAAAAGHPGQSKMAELLKWTYFWPKMQADVDRFVRNCHTCQRSCTPQHAPFGVLRPLPITDRPWQDITMDFVTCLLISQGYDAIWVVVDWLTKARHFVPCHSSVDVTGLADHFVQYIFRLHGLPNSIVSDCGPQFTAAFWQQLCNRLGINRCSTTAFHSESDGQTEHMNAIMV